MKKKEIKIGQEVFFIDQRWAKSDCPLCKGSGKIKIKPKNHEYKVVCPVCGEKSKNDMKINLFTVFKGYVTRIEKTEIITGKEHIKRVWYSGVDAYFSTNEVFTSEKEALKKAKQKNKELIAKEC